MKTLPLTLTDEQFARFQKLAAVLSTTPEHLVVAIAMEHLDAMNDQGSWGEYEEFLHDAIEDYAERGLVTRFGDGPRLEDLAPARRLRLAGYEVNTADA